MVCSVHKNKGNKFTFYYMEQEIAFLEEQLQEL
jgi:hypothetical protein